ncbi:MAG: hypothetical protein K2J81_07255 [Treponemataceae bacterium]|nr:hypothetical protein [Treponemataceae bacterium]
MRKTLLAVLWLGFFAVLSLGAVPRGGRRGGQELIPSGHWIYDALMAVSLESRTVNFADSAPLTVQELTLYLDEIDYDALSEGGRAQYDRIRAYFAEPVFSFGSDLISAGVEPSVNPEAFFKTNKGIDWTFDRYHRLPLISVPVSITVGDWVAMKVDVSLGENKGAMLHHDNYTNIPSAASEVDVNFPSYGYLSAGARISEKTGIGFQIALGPQSIGRSLNGSVIMSDYLTGTTAAKLLFYSPNIKYTGSVTEFNVDKYLYMHQFDVRLFKRVTFTLLEGVLVYAPLELRFLNPLTIFHGYSPWRDYGDDEGNKDVDDVESHICAYLGLKSEFVPVDGLRFYGMFAMTQFQTPYERSNWPDDKTPNGMGGQLGSEAFVPFRGGYLHFALEGYYAQPFLYIKEGPNWTLVRTYSENIGDHALFYEWVGSPFGPDTVSCELTAGYEKPGVFSVDGMYLFMARGEYCSGSRAFTKELDWGGTDSVVGSGNTDDDFKNWIYPRDGQTDWRERRDWITPTGTPEFVNRLAVRGSWYAKPWLKISAQPAYVFVFNHNHERGAFAHGFEMSLGVECSFFRL